MDNNLCLGIIPFFANSCYSIAVCVFAPLLLLFFLNTTDYYVHTELSVCLTQGCYDWNIAGNLIVTFFMPIESNSNSTLIFTKWLRKGLLHFTALC